MMQGSGYYQRDKTRWRTLYWTVREIIQRKLTIIPWHSFAVSNREGTKYFLPRSFSVLFNFPPRTNTCIEYSSTSVTSVLTFSDLERKWHHNSDEKVRVPSVSDSFAEKHFNDAQVLFSDILASPFFWQKFCNKSMMHDC